MEATRIQIPEELFSPAESSHFEGRYDLGRLEVGPDEYVFAEPLSWQVDVTNTGEALLVMGEVSGEARALCGRCLEEASFSLVGEITGYYLLEEQAARDLEDMEGDEFELLGEDEAIDLEGPIRAALLLELPLVPLCDDECKGLCLSCGSSLNEGPCGCEPEQEGEGSVPADNPFAVLRTLKLDD